MIDLDAELIRIIGENLRWTRRVLGQARTWKWKEIQQALGKCADLSLC